MSDHLNAAYPVLAGRVPKIALADLPTPLYRRSIAARGDTRLIFIKDDSVTGGSYGGNKVRKLEYLLRRAMDRDCSRVATFGTVASNHALATALYSSSLGLDCTCFLMHQSRTSNCPKVLNKHLDIGTEIVRFGGTRTRKVATLRQYLQGRQTWAIPAGGSCWVGVLGFVNAGLELADQISASDLPVPDRVYVANGTMGTAAGLALGLALAGLATEIQAVRVTHEFVANREAMRRLIEKTALLMHRHDASVPADLASRTRLVFRDEFFAGGYAHYDEVTETAVAVARDELNLQLEMTYTGKAMAALLHDLDQPGNENQRMLFWNTYNSRPLQVTPELPADTAGLPDEFLRYYG